MVNCHAMDATEFETDDMLKLLTEALRRGPGSPEWHHAVEQLRSSGAKEADDFRLLMTVRERLESGQSYREVRAGPIFTRELFDKIESDDENARGTAASKSRTTLAVTLVCIVLLLGSAAVLLKMMSNVAPRDITLEQLSQRLFVTPVKSWSFVRTIPEGLTSGGDLKLEATDGVRLARTQQTGYASLFATELLNLDDSICIEAQFQYRPGPGGGQVAMTIADVSNPSGAPGLGVSLQDEGFSMQNGPNVEKIQRNLQAGLYTVRIKLDAAAATIEVDGQTIWQGRHAVRSPAGLTIGMAKRGKDNVDSKLVSLRILKP